MKPLSSSQRVTPSIAEHVAGRGRQRLRAPPGRCAGTRCSAALTVVSRTDGRSRPLSRASRDSVVMRCADDAGMRRHAVVGQAVPGRELQHLDVGREERERARERRHARAVAADHQQAGRRRVRPRRDRAREIGDDQAFGAVGDAGERQRLAGRRAVRRETCRPCRSAHSRAPAAMEVAQARGTARVS